MKAKKKLMYIFILIMLVGIVQAEQQFLGTGKQNDCVIITQVCDNCTSVNFTGVTYPDLTFEVLALEGEQHGTVYNNTFCNTSQVGTYIINSVGDLNGIITTGNYNIDISQSGLDFTRVVNEYLLFVFIFMFLYLILVWAFNHTEKNIAMLSSFGILLMAVYIMIFGVANLKSDYTMSFSIINIGIGAYMLIRLGIEKIQEVYN